MLSAQDGRNNFGETAMHYAAFEGHEQVVNMLIGFNARLEVRNMVSSWSHASPRTPRRLRILRSSRARHSTRKLLWILRTGANGTVWCRLSSGPRRGARRRKKLRPAPHDRPRRGDAPPPFMARQVIFTFLRSEKKLYEEGLRGVRTLMFCLSQAHQGLVHQSTGHSPGRA